MDHIAHDVLEYHAFTWTRGLPMIVAPECAPAHIRGRYKSKRLLRYRIGRRRRSGMTSSQECVGTDPDFTQPLLARCLVAFQVLSYTVDQRLFFARAQIAAACIRKHVTNGLLHVF